MATSERALYRQRPRAAPKVRTRPARRATDDEKTGYSDRNLALIIRTSLASFGALLISQARFVFLKPGIHMAVPAVPGVHHRLLRHLPVR